MDLLLPLSLVDSRTEGSFTSVAAYLNAPWRAITERNIRRNSFNSVRELKQQIELFVRRYNADALPFQWVATADSNLQKIERIAKRISATRH